MTIHATKEMNKVVQALIDEGRITRSLYDYAVLNGYSDAEIIGARERVRMSAASLEIEGAPHRYKQSAPVANPGDPTPERQRKAGGDYLVHSAAGKGEAAPVRRYRLRSVMEIHGDKFGDEHRTVFAAFVGDADLHQRVRVADLNSQGGGGARLGGLGNVPDHIRDRHNRYEWVVARLTRLEKEVCDMLVSHCIAKRDGTPFSAEEYGALCYPMLADKSFHRGAAVNGFRHLCDHLVELMHSPMCPRVRRQAQDVIAYDHIVEGA